jgi:predicted Holliday junction resolvase-like endonuclease
MLSTLITLAVGIGIGLVVALLYVAAVKPRYTHAARRDAVSQSKAVTRGQIYEQFATYFPGFEFNPKDAQFLGKPVDFVVFDGLDEGQLNRIVFVEIKTGSATLNARERCVRDAVRRGAVEWREIRLGSADAPSASVGSSTPVRARQSRS